MKGKKARGNGGVVRVQGNEISIRQKERGSVSTGGIFMIKYAKIQLKRHPELNIWEDTIFIPCGHSVSSPITSTNPSQACADTNLCPIRMAHTKT